MARVKLFILGTLFLICFCSCSIRKMAMQEIVCLTETAFSAFERDDDLDLIEEAFPANIKFFEALIANDPNNSRILVLLARSYSNYTFAFIEGKLESRLLENNANYQAPDVVKLRNRVNHYYMKGMGYAMRAIELKYPEFRKSMKKVATAKAALNELSPEDVDTLFWYGFNLAAYINQNRDSIKAISKAYLVKLVMQRVLELKPSFYYGTPHLVLIAYYSRPSMWGGNLKLAEGHYNACKKIAGDTYLLADLVFARYFLYQKQSRQRYEQMLTYIVNHPDIDQKYRLFNEMAAKRAQIYLKATDELF